MKQILIDSLYINDSGGLRLLVYLVREMREREVDFFLLADSRCTGLFDDLPAVEYVKASLLNRSKWYQRDMSVFSSVLCFGNIPPPRKLEMPVYTYFHNIHLLTLSEAHSFPFRIKCWLKRAVYRYYKNNTDYWLVQTTNTSNELRVHLEESEDRIMLMPFYELPANLAHLKEETHGGDYVYVSTYVPGKGHKELLAAWRQIHNRGIDIKLHLTVPVDCGFAKSINEARREGVLVVNHGLVPFEQVIDLYKRSKAIIYPAHNESLGLGIVEAIAAGCDVLGSDLPFLYSVCSPSGVFDPYSPYSIAETVIDYERADSRRSTLLIENHIEDLIDLIWN